MDPAASYDEAAVGLASPQQLRVPQRSAISFAQGCLRIAPSKQQSSNIVKNVTIPSCPFRCLANTARRCGSQVQTHLGLIVSTICEVAEIANG